MNEQQPLPTPSATPTPPVQQPTQPAPVTPKPGRIKSLLLLLRGKNLKNMRRLPRHLKKGDRIAVIAAIVLLLGGIGAWIFVTVRSSRVPDFGGSYKEGIVGEPKFINPLFNQTSDADQDLSAVIYSSLIRVDQDRNLVGDLAESWTISPDGKTYTVKLRDGVQWHDGQALTANDVIFTVSAIENPDYASPLRRSLKGVTVSATDDHTVQFTLLEPSASFLSGLTFGILPEHIWETIPAASASVVEENRKPIGSGPYKFSELTKQKDTGQIISYKVVANPNYYAGRPYIDTITFEFYQTTDELIDAVNKGQVQSIHYVQAADRDKVTRPGVTVKSLALPAYTAIFMNVDKNVLLQDREIRRALNHGTNRQQLIDDVLNGAGQEVKSPLLPGFLGYDESIVPYEYSPEKARAMIEARGWVKGDDGIYKKGEQRLSFEVSTTDWDQNQKTVELLTKQWKEIGVELVSDISSVVEVQQNVIKPRSYDLLLFSQSLGADPDLYPYWHSSQVGDPGLNLASFHYKDVDKMLEEARTTADINRRTELHKAIQHRIDEEAQQVFLFSPYYSYPLSNKIHGFDRTRLTVPSDRFAEINRWYINTKRGN